MTNAEKYKDEIYAQICKTGNWAVNKGTGEIVGCNTLNDCTKCLFENNGGCSYDSDIAKWLNSEYKEPKKFTDDERKVIELLDKVEWVARDEDGEAYIFGRKPVFLCGQWHSDDSYCARLALFTSLPFAAIKSTDTEPTSRAEILGEK